MSWLLLGARAAVGAAAPGQAGGRPVCQVASASAARSPLPVPLPSPAVAVPHERDQWQQPQAAFSISSRGKAAAAVELAKELQVRCAAPRCDDVLCHAVVRCHGSTGYCAGYGGDVVRKHMCASMHDCVRLHHPPPLLPQERIRLRGCKEVFVPNADLLAEGQVGSPDGVVLSCMLGSSRTVHTLGAAVERHTCRTCCACGVLAGLTPGPLSKAARRLCWRRASLPSLGAFVERSRRMSSKLPLSLPPPNTVAVPSPLQVDFMPAAALSPEELERQRKKAEDAAKATR